ncbi:MAG: type I-E CRISPR-associated protein Cas6/Cse3/CasE, partial [Verrucomicrobiaceae bacterium]
EKRGGKLRFTSVDLTGQLTVTDPTAFQAMLLQGLGHAKAFGCGLMVVRRSL